MPVRKVGSRWQWGKHGKKYKKKSDAEKQAAAAYAHGYQGDSRTRLGLASLLSELKQAVVYPKDDT